MATAAMALESISFRDRASDGLVTASAAEEWARKSSDHLVRAYRTMVLGSRLSKLNRTVESFLDDLNRKVDSAKNESTPDKEDWPSRDLLVDASQRFLALHLVLDQVYRTCADHNFTNCSKHGISTNLMRLCQYSDQIWGWADWIQMLADPAECDQKVQDGLAEIESGDFVTLD